MTIGSLSATGPDGTVLANQGLTYALEAGDGADDNASVRLVGTQLQANEVVDRESRNALKVRIRVTDAAGVSFSKAFTIQVINLPDPIAIAPLGTATLAWAGPPLAVDLGRRFDDPLSTGQVATFQLAQVRSSSGALVSLGSGRIRVLLYDQSGKGAPLTTANLQAYLDANRYISTFIHRSVPGFVLQGGGFNLTSTAQGNSITPVSGLAPVANEYSLDRSNIRGTIAMAKLGGDPNSATSQWFWSLADNRAILNPQNGGFTVFGRVLDSTDLATLDAMAAVSVYNASSSLGSTFGELPLSNGNLNVDNLLRFTSISIAQQPELSYAVVSNSAPDLVETTLQGSELRLRPLLNQTRQVAITVRATSLIGESLDQTLQLQVQRRPTTQAVIRRLSDGAGNTVADLAQPTLAGRLTAALQADEQVSLLANGQAIGVATSDADGLGWSFRPSTALVGGADGTVQLQARVETFAGITADASTGWSLSLGSAARLEAPGSELLQIEDRRPLQLIPTPIGQWGSDFAALNAGSRTVAGLPLPGTGQRIALQGLNRYALSLRSAETSQITLDFGPGNHAFFLHDAWSPQSTALSAQTDAYGQLTAPRFDRLATIRMGDCTEAGATSLVDLTSPDFITGPITVVGGNQVGSRNVIWGSSADDTVICAAADTVIFGGAGRNHLQLGSGADRVQLVVGGGANDRVDSFDPSVDKLELWGSAAGQSPLPTLQVINGTTVLGWQGNQVTFTDRALSLPSSGALPAWILVV